MKSKWACESLVGLWRNRHPCRTGRMSLFYQHFVLHFENHGRTCYHIFFIVVLPSHTMFLYKMTALQSRRQDILRLHWGNVGQMILVGRFDRYYHKETILANLFIN